MMRAYGKVKEKAENLVQTISPDELPEVFGYLSGVPNQNDDPPYVIANKILDMDKPAVFPKDLIAFLTDLFEMEIVEGNSNAMNDMGAQYYSGNRGFEQSFEKAVHYYKMAAEHGNRQAQENLGYCYYYGRDGEPDYEKAFHYFALGAFDGHLISLYKIGDMYLKGLYVPKNEREAFFIYMRCIETMTDDAAGRVAGPVYLRLGRMFQEGIGTEKDLRNALICFQKAETFLLDMVMDGDAMYRKSLQSAVNGQQAVREKLTEQLPEERWEFDESACHLT